MSSPSVKVNSWTPPTGSPSLTTIVVGRRPAPPPAPPGVLDCASVLVTVLELAESSLPFEDDEKDDDRDHSEDRDHGAQLSRLHYHAPFTGGHAAAPIRSAGPGDPPHEGAG